MDGIGTVRVGGNAGGLRVLVAGVVGTEALFREVLGDLVTEEGTAGLEGDRIDELRFGLFSYAFFSSRSAMSGLVPLDVGYSTLGSVLVGQLFGRGVPGVRRVLPGTLSIRPAFAVCALAQFPAPMANHVRHRAVLMFDARVPRIVQFESGPKR
ncbi:hypothetical protein NGM33_23355 [Nocardiopsis dassonvillei]|nr:hypothetical protein [Nocardiopsis dassonvillei]MCP3016271.1 hypothetical protein [Nocardiopsis dassonvillei]